MARELYNWDQSRSYAIVAIHNLRNKNMKLNESNFIREYDSLQTMYGKEGIIGLAQRYIKQKENSN